MSGPPTLVVLIIVQTSPPVSLVWTSLETQIILYSRDSRSTLPSVVPITSRYVRFLQLLPSVLRLSSVRSFFSFRERTKHLGLPYQSSSSLGNTYSETQTGHHSLPFIVSKNGSPSSQILLIISSLRYLQSPPKPSSTLSSPTSNKVIIKTIQRGSQDLTDKGPKKVSFTQTRPVSHFRPL